MKDRPLLLPTLDVLRVFPRIHELHLARTAVPVQLCGHFGLKREVYTGHAAVLDVADFAWRGFLAQRGGHRGRSWALAFELDVQGLQDRMAQVAEIT